MRGYFTLRTIPLSRIVASGLAARAGGASETMSDSTLHLKSGLRAHCDTHLSPLTPLAASRAPRTRFRQCHTLSHTPQVRSLPPRVRPVPTPAPAAPTRRRAPQPFKMTPPLAQHVPVPGPPAYSRIPPWMTQPRHMAAPAHSAALTLVSLPLASTNASRALPDASWALHNASRALTLACNASALEALEMASPSASSLTSSSSLMS